MLVRFYISSADLTAEKFANAMRSHWDVENKLHWRLDVAMDREYLASVLGGGRGFVILPCKEGVVSGQDIDENYRLVSNDACPEGMPSLSFF
ncbi:Transposase [Salmonella enterica subsp. enterica serovar Newport str. 36807]|nr:Transposase [Salmonella enterica subsp. enterica serovar Newport str. 36807]